MAEYELTVKHRKQEYQVVLDGEAVYVDDSFDHEFGTEERGHWELDWEQTDIIAVLNDIGDEIDPEDVPGLTLAIRDASYEIEVEG